MFKTERFRNRQNQLDLALNRDRLKSLWKGHVRSNIRDCPITDLHDHYDFHLSLDNRVVALKDSILSGVYQPRRPLRFRSEKQNGMTRHLVTPHPADALALEAIADYLEPFIRKAQPTDRAYYSRNKPQPPSVESVDDSFDSPVFGYAWWTLWPKFQERIFQFADNKEIVVVTDVATYYDTIGFAQLRNFVASLGDFSEVFLDFLFFILERFVWRPDYLPHPGRGMPQLNLDCPRLLAHAFLYEADALLAERTNKNFVRWLDDIDFGCDSKQEAQQILGALDDLLLSRGLHLNSSKTKILTHKEAYQHFQIRENRYLTILGRRIDSRLASNQHIESERRRLRRRFYNFIKKRERQGQWNKVLKRYLTLFGKCADKSLDRWLQEFMFDHPDIRSSIFRYFHQTGWTEDRETLVKKYALQAHDEDGLFSALNLLMDWSPVSAVTYTLRMRELALAFDRTSSKGFLASLWLLGKYGTPQQLHELLTTRVEVWKTNDWIARQVASLFPRLQHGTQLHVSNVILRFGLFDAQSVLDNFGLIGANERKVINSVEPYVVAAKSRGAYPLSKTLICIAFLTGKTPAKLRQQVRNDAIAQIRCGRSKQLLRQVQIK